MASRTRARYASTTWFSDRHDHGRAPTEIFAANHCAVRIACLSETRSISGQTMYRRMRSERLGGGVAARYLRPVHSPSASPPKLRVSHATSLRKQRTRPSSSSSTTHTQTQPPKANTIHYAITQPQTSQQPNPAHHHEPNDKRMRTRCSASVHGYIHLPSPSFPHPPSPPTPHNSLTKTAGPPPNLPNQHLPNLHPPLPARNLRPAAPVRLLQHPAPRPDFLPL